MSRDKYKERKQVGFAEVLFAKICPNMLNAMPVYITLWVLQDLIAIPHLHIVHHEKV